MLAERDFGSYTNVVSNCALYNNKCFEGMIFRKKEAFEMTILLFLIFYPILLAAIVPFASSLMLFAMIRHTHGNQFIHELMCHLRTCVVDGQCPNADSRLHTWVETICWNMYTRKSNVLLLYVMLAFLNATVTYSKMFCNARSVWRWAIS